MDVKQQVLSYLELNKGKTFSGAKLAEKIGVSRTAIWKAVKSLEEKGYKITASTNKGYSLCDDNDKLSPQSIKPYLDSDIKDSEIIVFDTIDSTNTYAKEIASQGAKEFTVVIAEEQTKGKGRLGRTFYSPHSKGIYMSIILRPEMSAKQALLITTSTAVAVSDAIDDICNISTQIKWVNDIYYNEKKLCGILTEASIDFETGGLEYAIVGIGINVSTTQNDLPDDVSQIATSIYGDKETINRSALIGKILNNLNLYVNNLGDKSILDKYRERSFLIGREINVIKSDSTTPAIATGITDNAELIVQYKNGRTETLNSGEVSVRAIK